MKLRIAKFESFVRDTNEELDLKLKALKLMDRYASDMANVWFRDVLDGKENNGIIDMNNLYIIVSKPECVCHYFESGMIDSYVRKNGYKFCCQSRVNDDEKTWVWLVEKSNRKN